MTKQMHTAEENDEDVKSWVPIYCLFVLDFDREIFYSSNIVLPLQINSK